MDKISYADFLIDLANQMDKVNQDHKPLLVTRKNAKPIVVMSLDNFQSYEETAYLMASPKNGERLNQAISEMSQGNVLT